MIQAMQQLLELQTLDFSDKSGKDMSAQAAELRNQIPVQILGHYERLRERGKKGVAPVVNNVCTGCHMSIPIGKITILRRGEDIQLCDNCGRYLCLPNPTAEPAQAEPATKPARKRPARKAPAIA